MPPNQYWYCCIAIYVLFSSTMCSNLLLVSMTFQRFYSIIQPHKAASFNTVKRAKITIVCIVMFSFIFRSPHLFATHFRGKYCIPYSKILDKISGQFYYWLTFVLNFIIPFVSLVIMNSVIIRTLYKRSKSNLTEIIEKRKVHQCQDQNQGQFQGQSQGQGQTHPMKSVERQIYTMLLLVTFGYLLLTTPGYAMLFYVNYVDYLKSPYNFAAYVLFFQVGEKTYYSNFGINFFLYVLSGQKFRNDLVKLFAKRERKAEKPAVCTSEVDTVSSSLSAPSGY